MDEWRVSAQLILPPEPDSISEPHSPYTRWYYSGVRGFPDGTVDVHLVGRVPHVVRCDGCSQSQNPHIHRMAPGSNSEEVLSLDPRNFWPSGPWPFQRH